jgi:lipopolysaccharide cholinephosphotransferase
MATLKEIHNCELNILKAVTEVCEHNKIPYYLSAGTLLGAVRHQGFIPWDDDIDIFVMNKDLKRLKRACKKELPPFYFWQDYKTDKGTPYIMPKIRDTRTVMSEANNTNTNQGIWIDIFPLIDAAPANKFEKQVFYINRYQYYLANQMKILKTKYRSFASMVFRICRELFVFRPLTVYYYHRAIASGSKKTEKLIELDISFFGDVTDEMVQIIRRRSYNADLVKHTKKYPFEQYEFTGFEDADQYLTVLYGKDYMTPKRYSHFSDYSHVIINQY